MQVFNIAHRGARSVAPENTLAAARKAFALGADMWELDAGLTADGEIVVIHDDSLTRTSDACKTTPGRAPWRVRDFTLAELRRLDFGSWFAESDPFGQIAAGAVTEEELMGYARARIPTLSEALTLTRELGWKVNVEIKDMGATGGGENIARRVATLAAGMGMEDRVLVSSFRFDYLRQIREAGSAVATAVLVSSPAPDPAAIVAELGASAYNPCLSAITLRDVAPLREKGIDVNVWTVNDEETMTMLIEAEVSGIFTDFPQRLARILRKTAPSQ